MRSRHLLATLLLSLPGATGWSTEAGRPHAPDGGSGILLVDCAGTYLRVATGGAAPRLADQGYLWRAPGADVLRESEAHRFDGCLVEDTASDPEGKFLYLIAARTPFLDAEGTRGYRVASLRLPELKVTSYVDLEDVADGPLSLLLALDSSELLVSYPGNAARPEEVQLLQLPISTTGIAGKQQARATVAGDYLSGDARWVARDRILDGHRVLDGSGQVLRRVDPYVTFGPWAKEMFPELMRKNAQGKPYVDISFADASANRMLFVVNPDWDTGSAPIPGGLVIYDLASGKVVAIHTPIRPADKTGSGDTPTARLTPDGKRVVLEEHEYEREEDFRRRTGTIRIYDAGSGHLLSTVFLADQPGFSGNERITGFAQREQLMFYGNREKIFVIDLLHGVLRATLEPEIQFDPNPAIGVVSYGPGS